MKKAAERAFFHRILLAFYGMRWSPFLIFLTVNFVYSFPSYSSLFASCFEIGAMLVMMTPVMSV